MPAKKKGNAKGNKMSLGDFLNEGPSNMSWADDDLALPSAPMAAGAAAAAPRTSVNDAPDRKDLARRDFDGPTREPRAPVDFPTEPPYTALVGNMPFSVDEAMLRSFFSGVQSVRLVRDRDTDKLKGFGYVQVETLEALKEAVAKDGQELGGRQLRINVAERRVSATGAAYEDRTGGASNWRRADAVPEPATSPFQSRSSSGFGRTPSSGRGELREPREPREPLPPSAAEKVSDWRQHKEPAAAAETQSPPHQHAPLPPRRAGFGDRFSRSSSGAGPDSGDEPRVWRRERRDSDSATPPPPARREPREYQPPRDRSASREPTRVPRQATVAEQANTWRAVRAPAAEPVPAPEPVSVPEPVVTAPAPESVVPAVDGDDEGWSHVEKPVGPRRAPPPPAGVRMDRNRSASGRHHESHAVEPNGDAEKRSPRPSERRGFFAGRDATATESTGSWRR